MNKTRKVITCVIFFTLIILLHRPLPATFTDNLLDRFIMYHVGIVLRLLYVYPTRICSSTECELKWTRSALKLLMAVVGPWNKFDDDIVIKDFKVNNMKSRVYLPLNRSSDAAIIYIHGGGFVLGTMDMYENVVRQIVKNTRLITFSMDYRLAPEHGFPAALDDCEYFVMEVYKNLTREYAIDKNRIAIVGDSAGAGLIASLTYRLRRFPDFIKPKVQALIYPLVQMHNFQTPSYEYFYRVMDGTGFVDPRLIAQYYLMYANVVGAENEQITRKMLRNEHLSIFCKSSVSEYMNLQLIPMHLRYGRNITSWKLDYCKKTWNRLMPFLLNAEFAPIVQRDFTNLPKALIVTMEHDILRDEGIVYAQRLRQAGVPTTWKHFDSGFHAILNFYNVISNSNRVVNYVSGWVSDNV